LPDRFGIALDPVYCDESTFVRIAVAFLNFSWSELYANNSHRGVDNFSLTRTPEVTLSGV